MTKENKDWLLEMLKRQLHFYKLSIVYMEEASGLTEKDEFMFVSIERKRDKLNEIITELEMEDEMEI